ncbi:MAG TPA: molybdate ABC transporter substrate-binding protein [Steroidobacteraceae bacterium]|nr:molybdate ABC transporter substrate-binding protein [Steroidobacteraceae bacterium]
MTRALILAVLLTLAGSLHCHAAERGLTVFAAASLTDALGEVGEAYARRSGIPVRFSFAGSSALARQIESGAPADAFVSADQEWMDYLEQRRLIVAATRADVASNVLVLVAPADSRLALKIAPGFSLAQGLGPNGRLAIGDPQAVPAGRYARAALNALGAWDGVSRRIIAADNVRTALNFVALGEAPLGIVYATDVRGNDRVRVVDTFPPGLHERITYPAAATTRGSAQARDFLQYLRGSEARAILVRHGFTVP